MSDGEMDDGGAAAAVAWAVASAQEVPRTPWGDPDLRGTYTSDNSIGVPFERPAQFGERAELTDEEYSAKVNANEEQIAKDQNPLPESEFSADDPSAINASRHWLERPDVPSRATSLVVDPPNGRLPELTPAGQQRARGAARAARPRLAGVVHRFHATTIAASRAASSARSCPSSTATARRSCRRPVSS